MTYDYVSLITYVMVVVLGIVFGIISMKNAEDYWTKEFWDYAKKLEKEEKEKIKRSLVLRCLRNHCRNTKGYIYMAEYNGCLENLRRNNR